AAKEAHDEASLARALMVIGDASVLIEGPGEGTEIREALAIYEKLGDLRLQACAMDSLGFGCAYAGRWEEAVSWLQSARDGYRRSGDEVSAAYMDMNLGIMRVNQNRIDEAELILTGCIRVMRSGEFEHGVASAETHLARVRTAQGAFDDAIAILNNVVDYFDGVGQTLQKLEALSYLAIALTDAGKAEDALSLLNQAERASPREWDLQLPTMLIA
ncbi:MAG: tetratricopeptide repeat protein, partial [Gammaproteobacteria bacterium]